MKRVLHVFLSFLRLGATGFGGPLALLALMQRDFVEKEKWISLEEFQRAFTLVKSMPGAVAFNTGVYLGRRHAGWAGGFAAAVGLLLPSFVFILVFAASYGELRSQTAFARVLLGMQAAALALILAALKNLAGPWLKQPVFIALACAGAAIFATNRVPEPALIVGGGLLWLLARHRRAARSALGAVAIGSAEALPKIFWICFKAGAFVFGSGVAIAPLLERDFVADLGWVTHAEFMDALAIGQVTPGPVLLTTTFLGYKVAGLSGAFVATGSVFLAGFIHMMTWFPLAVAKLSDKKWLENFLFGALAMVVGTIVVTVFTLGSEWTSQPVLYVLSLLSLLATLKWKAPSWAVILVSGAAAVAVL